MTEEELNQKLMSAFPEIEKELLSYMEEEDGWNTGCFLTHEDVLHPLIREAFQNGNEDVLKRLGAYVEELLVSDDSYAINVAMVGIVEWLASEYPHVGVDKFLVARGKQAFFRIRRRDVSKLISCMVSLRW